MTIETLDGVMSYYEPGHGAGSALAKVYGVDHAKGGPADWKLLNAGWAQADAVLGSGEELREEDLLWIPQHEDLQQWRQRLGKSKYPLQVVVTKSGDLPVTHPFFTQDDIKGIIYTSKEGENLIRLNLQRANVKSHVAIHSYDAKDLGELLLYLVKHLRQHYKVEYLDVTAGSIILGQFYAHKLVDELRLTISGQFIGPYATTEKLRPSIYNVGPSQTGRIPPHGSPGPQIEFTDLRAFHRHLYIRGRVLKET